jgi:prepilin-type N-terminal cleavage/methylation domain-containing protein
MQLVRDRTPGDRGFTMPELIVATGIILTVMAGFMVFITGVFSTQRSAELEKTASRVLAQQVAVVEGLAWDNLMMGTEGSNSDCPLDQGRVSTQAISTSTNTYQVGHEVVSISREARWFHDHQLITCAAGVKDQADMKVITLTAHWDDHGTTRTRQATVLRSRWAETTPDPASVARQGSTLKVTVPVDDAAGWCQAPAGGSAAVDTGKIVVTFSSPTIACNYLVSGLTAGRTYTAVMDVYVPSNGSDVALNVTDAGNAGRAIANGTTQTVVKTWTETGTERAIGPIVADSNHYTAGSTATISSLVVYEN